jgi:hypothetical protein
MLEICLRADRVSVCVGMRPRRFKSVVPEIPIVLCTNCNHFFHEEDFEFASLQKKECPFCKVCPRAHRHVLCCAAHCCALRSLVPRIRLPHVNDCIHSTAC